MTKKLEELFNMEEAKEEPKEVEASVIKAEEMEAETREV